MAIFTHLECAACRNRFESAQPRAFCDCGGELLARYDLAQASVRRGALDDAGPDMWRYADILPVSGPPVSMGEGWTPLIRCKRMADRLGVADLWIKQEGANPTGSWEARGYSCTVSAMRGASVRDVAAVANDDAAVACAAYAGAARLNAQVTLSAAATAAHRVECAAYGGRPGTAAEHDPYRLEGLKTTAYEILEQSDWTAPAVIVCPGEEGARPIRKALEELGELGWIRAGVSQVVAAPEIPLHDALDLGLELAAEEAILPSPAGAACLAAAREHRGSVVVINPASGSRYAELYARRMPLLSVAAETDKLGGLITPR